MRNATLTKYASSIAALAGLWAFVAPFLWEVGGALTWSNWAAGALVAVLAGYNAWWLHAEESAYDPAATLALLAGLWLVVAPFLLSAGVAAFQWSTVAAGALTAVLVGYGLYSAPERTGWRVGRPSA